MPRQKYLSLFFVIAAMFSLTHVVRGQTGSGESKNESGLLAPTDGKKDLYPDKADAKKEIDDALKTAAGHKRVLLVFGGNWCYDCHVLDQALHEGTAGKIMNDGFVLVHVDIGEANKNLDLTKKYKIPLEKGVPAVAVLGSDGALLYSSGDGEFEAARTMMRKDLVAFLKRWQEPELNNKP
jgi:thioredoxin 1